MVEKLKYFGLNNAEKIDNILKQFEIVNKTTMELRDKFDDVYKKVQGYYKELNFADLLHDSVVNSTWLKDKTFSLHGWAANYSFIYMLYRILDNVKPQNILEMGMGQTSRLNSQYVAYNNQNAMLDIIENDDNWIKFYQSQLVLNNNIKIHKCDIEIFVDQGTECRKYMNLNEVTNGKKYDLIIIDGPYGGNQTLPRSNILDLIKNHNLADDFVIVFDDSERLGEQNTIEHTLNLLKEQNINVMMFCRNGIKEQTYITSLSRSLVQYL